MYCDPTLCSKVQMANLKESTNNAKRVSQGIKEDSKIKLTNGCEKKVNYSYISEKLNQTMIQSKTINEHPVFKKVL